MAADTAGEVQAMLRFLTQDARVPLATAMPKIGALRTLKLTSPSLIATSSLETLQGIFNDEKTTKQVLNAAKRSASNKKRPLGAGSVSPTYKRSRVSDRDPDNLEDSLALPTNDADVDTLEHVMIETNRAPLALAFAVVLLKYTMPHQPLSSRLSLAQAMVSANSQSKAKSIGLSPGPTAQDEGWAEGQPKVQVMQRQIAVMRRHMPVATAEAGTQETITSESSDPHQALWGIDLDALRKANGPLVAGRMAHSGGPPVHTPQAARNYLLKSMVIQGQAGKSESTTKGTKKALAAEMAMAKEQAVAMMLKAIDLALESWSSTLSADELDRRAWSWYTAVRPDVAAGQAGWGQRGSVALSAILKLRQTP